MLRSSAPVLTSLLLSLLGAALAATNDTVSYSVRSCAALDIALLHEYVTGLNVSDVRLSNDTDAFASGESQQLPFGALPSDWSRLLLLQNRQPKGTPLRENLLRLSRVLLAAYFDSEDGAEWRTKPTVVINDGQGASSTTSKDQQANNSTPSSAAHKRINTSVDNDEPTTAYYDEANFNQTSLLMDNEASGKGGEKSAVTIGDNEDGTGLPETSGIFFVASSLADESLGTVVPGVDNDRFASTVANDEKSFERSGANEAVHSRSKEDFVESKYLEKQNKDDLVARFFASDESVSSYHITSDELVNDFFAMEDETPKVNESSVEETTERLTKSLEDFFADDDNNNNTFNSMENVSFEFNSTKSIEEFFAMSEEMGKQTTTTETLVDFKSQDSVEDFFAHENDFAANTTEGNSTSDEVPLTKSVEEFFASKEANETVIMQEDGNMNKVASSESNKVIDVEKSNDTLVSSTKLEESTSVTLAVVNATSSDVIANETNPADSNTSEPITNTTKTSRSVPLDTSTSAISENDTLTSTELIPTTSESNNLTTLAQLISGSLFTTLSPTYANEMTPPANEMENRTAKYSDTMEGHDKAGTATSLSGEGRTTDRPNDLFSGMVTEHKFLEDDSSVAMESVTQAFIEEVNAGAPAPLVRLTRHILMTSVHDDTSAITVPVSAESTNSALSSKHKGDMGESKEFFHDPSVLAFSGTQRYRRGARISKRNNRKRAGAELDDDKEQYRTFLDLEPRQTQFAEKRSKRGVEQHQQQRRQQH